MSFFFHKKNNSFTKRHTLYQNIGLHIQKNNSLYEIISGIEVSFDDFRGNHNFKRFCHPLFMTTFYNLLTSNTTVLKIFLAKVNQTQKIANLNHMLLISRFVATILNERTAFLKNL